MKILWLSDNPLFPTGFGRVTREITIRLASLDGVQVACQGWGYSGPLNSGQYPLVIYPSAAGQCGKDTFDKAVEHFAPDVVITLGEPWMVEWLTKHPDRRKVKWVAYVPIDAGPFYPPWARIFENMDAVVVMSQFGRKVLKDGLPLLNAHLIPHGVDTAAFYKLSERSQMKSKDPYRDKFVVGCVARNQPRKNIPALVKAMAIASEKVGNLYLYLHMNQEDWGFDLKTLLKRYRLEDKATISTGCLSDRALTDRELNCVYNLCDITVLPSFGEGFGLPIVESLAAGVPVVATDCSACSELIRGHGELVRVQTMLTVGRNLIENALIDVEDLARCILKLHANPTLREEYGNAGRAFVESLTWDAVFPRWLEVLDLIMKETTGSISDNMPLTEESTNKEVCVSRLNS